MKIIETNVAETLIFKIDYRTIPELLEFAKENPRQRKFIEIHPPQYRCIRDVDYTDAVHHYIFFGFAGNNNLYSLGLYACETEECFRKNIENGVIKPSKEVLNNIIFDIKNSTVKFL